MPHNKCHGCSLCLLSCPMWQQQRDVQFSPQGIAKALQHNATQDEIAPALFTCLLCGACDALCPEEIDITGMMTSLRKTAFDNGTHAALKTQIQSHMAQPSQPEQPQTKAPANASTIIVAGKALRSIPDTLNKVVTLLSNEANTALAADDGDDIALALESGIEIPQQRLHAFLQPLKGTEQLYVSNSHLLKQLRRWLPTCDVVAIGHHLSQLASLTSKLNRTDLYLIEPRSYHLDHKKKVAHYDRLRHQHGCHINLDLQRNAIPTTAGGLSGLHPQLDRGEQMRWLLSGHNIERIVVECAEDGQAVSRICDLPVLHLADLMEH